MTTADGFGQQFGSWPNRLHGDLTTWISIDTDNFFFGNDVIMSSLVTNLSSLTAQEIVNRVTTAGGCIHTADTTQLDLAVTKFVWTRRDCRQLVANSVHDDSTRQLSPSWVASASVMCTGLKLWLLLWPQYSGSRAEIVMFRMTYVVTGASWLQRTVFRICIFILISVACITYMYVRLACLWVPCIYFNRYVLPMHRRPNLQTSGWRIYVVCALAWTWRSCIID